LNPFADSGTTLFPHLFALFCLKIMLGSEIACCPYPGFLDGLLSLTSLSCMYLFSSSPSPFWPSYVLPPPSGNFRYYLTVFNGAIGLLFLTRPQARLLSLYPSCQVSAPSSFFCDSEQTTPRLAVQRLARLSSHSPFSLSPFPSVQFVRVLFSDVFLFEALSSISSDFPSVHV